MVLSSFKWVKAKNEEAGWPTQPTRDVSVCREEKLAVVVCSVFVYFSLAYVALIWRYR